jgi:hypothetical protein
MVARKINIAQFKPPSEDQEQMALMRWAQYHPICRDYLIHIPNGGSRHLLEARKLKLMGVKAGVSDLFLAYPANGYHGWWGEGKSLNGKLTDKQKEWLDRMKSVGYKTDVWYGVIEAKKFIEEYLKPAEKG